MLNRLQAVCPELRREVPMDTLTTFRVGGPAEYLARPDSVQTAVALVKEAALCGIPLAFLGRGSNVLVSDNGVRGLVVHTGGLTGLSWDEGGRVTAECGVSLPELSKSAHQNGFSGLEWASGIPGTLGGAVLLNAGAYGGQLSDVCQSVTVWDGEAVREITDHNFGYRRSIYTEHPEWLVLGAALQLKRDDTAAIAERMEDFNRRRKEKQPLNLPSAGSFFKRPEGHFAGALIEQCGLKGYSVGGAQVSPKHAGFIVNTGGATCRDILALAEHIQKTVLTRTGVSLQSEVRLMGDIAWSF